MECWKIQPLGLFLLVSLLLLSALILVLPQVDLPDSGPAGHRLSSWNRSSRSAFSGHIRAGLAER